MTIDEAFIGEALLRSNATDLDSLLLTIEAYRACMKSASRLLRSRCMQVQREQLLECAGHCRKALEAYAATGRLVNRGGPISGEAHFTFTLG